MNYFFPILSVLVVGVLSCGKFPSNSCDMSKECYTLAPDSLIVELQLSPNSLTDTMIVQFYEGNVDDGELLLEFETTEDREYFYVPVRNRFSAAARYKRGSNFYTAIDGKYISVTSSTNCEMTCFNWDNQILDLQLDLED